MSDEDRDTQILIELAEMHIELRQLRSDVAEIKTTQVKTFVTKAQFEPVRLIAYGITGAGLFALLNQILSNAAFGVP